MPRSDPSWAPASKVLRIPAERGRAVGRWKDTFAKVIAVKLQHAVVARQEYVCLSVERKEWSEADLAAMTSAKAKNASRWLTAVPNSPWLKIKDWQFREAIALRLRVKADQSTIVNIAGCRCAVSMRESADHCFVCAGSCKSATFARHERVVRCVARLAAVACVTVQLNVMDRELGSHLQPDFTLEGLTCRIVSDVSMRSHHFRRRSCVKCQSRRSTPTANGMGTSSFHSFSSRSVRRAEASAKSCRRWLPKPRTTA